MENRHILKKTQSNFIILVLFLLLVSIPSLCLADVVDKRGSRGLVWQSNSNASESYRLGNYYALIIGNNSYQDDHGVWKPLKTAVNDAKEMASILEDKYGFNQVTLLENADRNVILEELAKLYELVEPNDNVLVYYAGHGHLEDNQKRGYWVPVDAKGMQSGTFIRNSTIRDEMNILAEKAKHTLLISDSCFSGDLLRSGNRGPTTREISQGYYKKVARKKSVQVFAAGGKEYVDDNYRNSGHSPFTYFLLNELKTNENDLVSLAELSTNVIKAVSNNVDQTPAAGVLHGAGDELGEFVFARLSTNVSGEIENTIPSKAKQIPIAATKTQIAPAQPSQHKGSSEIFNVEELPFIRF